MAKNARKKQAKRARKGPQTTKRLVKAELALLNATRGKKRKRRNRKKRSAVSSIPRMIQSHVMSPTGVMPVMLGGSQYGSYRMTIPFREECLGSVSTAVAFTNTGFILNPGNNVTFPWLSTIASKFEKYEMKRLYFRFDSSSANSVASTNTALGTMMGNTNYDVLDSLFTSQQQMENYGGISEFLPNISWIHEVDCKGFQGGVPRGMGGERFVLVSTNNGPASNLSYPTASSAHDYDLGLFQLASSGAQAASVAGRLYVGYDIELIRPKTETPVGQNLIAAHFTGVPVSTTSAFGTNVTKSSSNFTTTFTANTFTLPAPGRWLVVYLASGSTSCSAGTGITAGTNGTVVASAFDNAGVANATGSGISAASTAASNTQSYAMVLVDATAPGVVMTCGTSTIVGTAAYDLLVTQWPGGLALEQKVSVIDRLSQLESQFKKMLVSSPYARLTSETDTDYEESKDPFDKGSSSSSSQNTKVLSDSVVDLITSKLRAK